MKFFDRVNFFGRLLVGIYLVFFGISWFFASPNNMSNWLKGFSNALAFIEILGGFTIILGIKPRASAAIAALILLILSLIQYAHWNFQSFSWSSALVHFLMDKLAIFGALLFIAGTRMIPYGLMIRSEESMNEKYGGKEI